MKTITIVTPFFNQLHLSKVCLKSLIDGANRPHHLIIVDNNSTDDTPAFLKQFSKETEQKGWQVTIITNEENRGFGVAMNQGIELSDSDYIGLLNNDTWIMPEWDKALVDAIEQLDAAMIGPYYDESPFDEKETPQKAKLFVQKNRGKSSGDWCSVLMFFKRETFDTVGMFDERYFVSFEDTDLRERIKRAGLTYYTVADCFIWHHSRGTRKNLIPSTHEIESYKKFFDKWGFDPRIKEQTKQAKLKRWWKKLKNRFGYF